MHGPRADGSRGARQTRHAHRSVAFGGAAIARLAGGGFALVDRNPPVVIGADAQLPVVIRAPALDAATAEEGAGVPTPHADGSHSAHQALDGYGDVAYAPEG
ncbi:MAG: hypothetical protein FWC42_10570 [Proteobacteria bacterium]|nr:hypothetical protein [Pseudomonadota bacterium]